MKTSAPANQSADRVQIFGIDFFGNLDSSGRYPTVSEEKNSNFEFESKIIWSQKFFFATITLINLEVFFASPEKFTLERDRRIDLRVLTCLTV